MSNERIPQQETPSDAAGGFGPAMAVFTPTGPQQIADLDTNDRVFAMEPTTGLVKRKRVTATEQVPLDDPLVTAEARRLAMDVAANQPVPYHPRGSERVRFTDAQELVDRTDLRLLHRWSFPPRDSPSMIDITTLCDRFGLEYEVRASHPGPLGAIRNQLPPECTPRRHNKWADTYQLVFGPREFKRHQAAIESMADQCRLHGKPKTWWRPYKFTTERFCRFLGWLISEGSATRKPDRETAEVSIAQRRDDRRALIATLLESMGFDPSVSDSSVCFSSELYGDLLESLTGSGSYSMRLPELVWSLSRHHRRILLDALMAGDGSTERQVYYTASEQLRDDVCRLALSVGIKPRYFPNGEHWAVSLSRIRDQVNPQQVTRCESESGWQLTVEDYPVVLVGRDGKFQWVGVNRVV